MALTSCEGALKDKVFFHPPAASALVQEILAVVECSDVSISALTSSLPDGARSWAHDALAGKDVGGPVPTNAPDSESKPHAKPRKRSANLGEAAEAKPPKKPLTVTSRYFDMKAAKPTPAKEAAKEDDADELQPAESDGEALD